MEKMKMAKKMKKRAMVHALSERERLNEIGHRRHFGSCEICGDTWDWKQPHLIRMNEELEVFPYCEECEKTATKKEKFDACEKLIKEWVVQTSFLRQTLSESVVLYDAASKLFSATE